MITELTAEQKARFPEFAEKWTRIGLCTDPANRPAAEEGVRLAYRTAGFKPPQKIVWCDSPFAIGRARYIARRSTRLACASLDAAMGSVWDSVAYSIGESFLVWESLLDSAWARASVLESVANSIWDSFGYSVRSSVRGVFNGAQTVSWCSFCDYFRIVCGLSKQTEKMLGLMQVTENAGWWLPHRYSCWICERPNRLKLDGRERLHCEDGPAITYPDGFAVYSIHGVRLDEQVVMNPRSQSVDVIRNERDAEVKRIRIERFGWPEYLRAVGAVVLDTRHNVVEATREALMQTDDQVVLVCACPSTSRVYCLEVPPDIMTCEAAQDWLSGGLSRRVINGA